MDIKELQKNWDDFGKIDPMWAILTQPNKKGNKWQIDEFFETGVKEIDAVMKYVESLGINISRKKALDFGCGVGRLTQALALYFDEVCGVDIAPSMIELAKKYNQHDNCRYYLNDTDDLRLFPNNTFDFIYSLLTLQHMEPRYSKNYIMEFLRILVPRGLVIFQIPSEIKPVLKQTAITEPLPDSAFKAEIVLDTSFTSMVAGSQKTLLIKVRNISDVTWPALGANDGKYQINLGNHWLDKDEKIVINDDGRAMLPKDLAPGDEVELSLTITAPKKPNNYILELDMVQEMVTWFKDKGSKTTRIKVEIIPPKAFGKVRILKFLFDIFYLNPLRRVFYERKKGVFGQPKMEMYVVKREDIVKLLEKNGGKIVNITEDGIAGPNYVSFRYFVTK